MGYKNFVNLFVYIFYVLYRFIPAEKVFRDLFVIYLLFIIVKEQWFGGSVWNYIYQLELEVARITSSNVVTPVIIFNKPSSFNETIPFLLIAVDLISAIGALL